MSEEIEYPILFSVIMNAVGFYYCYATQPERILQRDDEIKYVEYEEDELEMIKTIATGVYVHLTEGGFVDVGSE